METSDYGGDDDDGDFQNDENAIHAKTNNSMNFKESKNSQKSKLKSNS